MRQLCSHPQDFTKDLSLYLNAKALDHPIYSCKVLGDYLQVCFDLGSTLPLELASRYGFIMGLDPTTKLLL